MLALCVLVNLMFRVRKGQKDNERTWEWEGLFLQKGTPWECTFFVHMSSFDIDGGNISDQAARSAFDGAVCKQW